MINNQMMIMMIMMMMMMMAANFKNQRVNTFGMVQYH